MVNAQSSHLGVTLLRNAKLCLGLIAFVAATFIHVSSPAIATPWSPQDPKSGTFARVGACETPEQLDCIESIGAYINGELVNGALTDRFEDPGSELTDGVWVPIEREPEWFGWHSREWLIRGLTNEDGASLIRSYGTVVGPNTSEQECKPLGSSGPCASMFAITITASYLDGFRVPWESGDTNCGHRVTNETDPQYGLCTREGKLQAGVKFRTVVRTSWTLPTVVVSKSEQTVVTTERLAINGAHRVVIEGIPYETVGLGPGVDFKKDPKSRASWNDLAIKMQIIDGRVWQSGKYAKCATQPTVVIADNSWTPSTPTFGASNGLELNLTNSHFNTDGKTPFEGRYNSTVPLAMASCLWGENLNSKSQFTAEVIEDTNGVKKAATTVVSVNSTNLKISAYGFTFSSPTIRVNYIPSNSNITSKKSPKIQTITCKKGSRVMKVKALRPQCPKGWKKP